MLTSGLSAVSVLRVCLLVQATYFSYGSGALTRSRALQRLQVEWPNLPETLANFGCHCATHCQRTLVAIRLTGKNGMELQELLSHFSA